MATYTFDEQRLLRLEAGQEALLGAVSANTTTLQLVLATLERVASALEKPDDGSLADALRGVEARLGGAEDHLRGIRQQLATVVHSLAGGVATTR